VLLLIDVLAQAVLLAGQLGLIGVRQFFTVSGAHVALFFFQVLFFLFELRSFAGRERAIFPALFNALLLVVFSFLNRLAGYRCAAGGCSAGLGKGGHGSK